MCGVPRSRFLKNKHRRRKKFIFFFLTFFSLVLPDKLVTRNRSNLIQPRNGGRGWRGTEEIDGGKEEKKGYVVKKKVIKQV